jgi:PAS domain S-box-containing protein
MIPFFQHILDTTGFPARWNCGQWSAGHGWLHIVSDIAIFGAYAAIPLALTYFIRRRTDVPFVPIFWLFAAFIVSCGLTHLIEATIFWHPWYRLSGFIKGVTAVLSWATVIALLKVIPSALSLPGLAKINRQLSEEIAERTRTTAALRESEERFRAAVSAVSSLIWTNDAAGMMKGEQPGWADFTGQTEQEYQGHGWANAVHPDDAQPTIDAWIRAVAEKRLFEFEHRLRRRDGEWRLCSIRAVPVLGEDGAVREWVGVHTDITERQRGETALLEAKQAAEAANQSKDRFLAVLSHELRTPLTPVLMAVGSLENDPGLRSEVREDLAMIKRNVELETKLIDDLLDLSRITSGKVELKCEDISPNEAVRNVCGICRPQLVERNVRLETDFDEGLCYITADSARLQQILWNVLKNAVKFTPENGVVRVSTAQLSGDRCEVRVEDSGIGIPPEVLPRIFNAFEQGDSRITRQFGGLGLGLAISRALVALHGGTIRAESEGLGKGATFIVEFPSRSARLPGATAVPCPDASLGLERMRVLLVEDHADTARTLARLLRAAGLEIVAAGDVASAIRAAEHERFDVLVSDLGLPDGDGYQVMNAVRARRVIPGIAMSGYGMEEDMQKSRQAGFSEHLVKPIEVSQLIASIRRVTDRG